MKILKFTASWCTKCDGLQSVINTLPTDQQQLIEECSLDYDVSMSIKYGVRTVPALIKVDDLGVEISRLKQASSATLLQLTTWISE